MCIRHSIGWLPGEAFSWRCFAMEFFVRSEMQGRLMDAPFPSGLGPRMQFHELGTMHREIVAAHGGILDAVPVALAVLNDFWQVLFTNIRFNHLLGLVNPLEVLGLRLGEVGGCGNAGTSLSGCGTSLSCPGCSVFKGAYQGRPEAGMSVPMVLPVVGAVNVSVGWGTPLDSLLRVCAFHPA